MLSNSIIKIAFPIYLYANIIFQTQCTMKQLSKEIRGLQNNDHVELFLNTDIELYQNRNLIIIEDCIL